VLWLGKAASGCGVGDAASEMLAKSVSGLVEQWCRAVINIVSINCICTLIFPVNFQ
jgi:hypothetical protein